MHVDLICLPYAGGSAAAYAPLRKQLPPWLQMIAIDLPGHGRRFSEPLVSDRAELVRLLVRELQPRLERPYAFFGHSLGGLLAFELAHVFEANGASPLALYVSAAEAPSNRNSERLADTRTDEGVLATLKRLGGTPPEVMANAELMEIALPMLRADFALCHGPAQRLRPQLACPIRAFAGTRDSIPWQDLKAWRDESSAGFELECFDGDHFFIREHGERVMQSVARHLATLRHEPP